MINKIGICEVCEKEKPVSSHYSNMLFCDECWLKEELASAEHQSLANQQKRVDEYNLKAAETVEQNRILRESQQIDNKIQLRTDIFNAATKSILDIKASIDSDPSIENKPYKLAEVLTQRFNHFKTVVFELNNKIVEAGNEERATQVYLNQLANTLRAEEREKLKIADINYKPNSVKTISVKRIPSLKPKNKIDKKELRAAASKLGVSEFTLQMIVVQKNISIEDAVLMLQKIADDSKSSNNT